MNTNKVDPENLFAAPPPPYMFIGVNFSKLTGSHQIFKIDISSVHFHLGEISCHN